MRIALVLAVVMGLVSPGLAQPASRAVSVVDGLGVDQLTANKLVDILQRHDSELAKLQRQRSELKRRLVTARHADPKNVDRLLDESIANQRALAQAEEQLITRVRQIVPAQQAAHLLVLLAATEPPHGRDAPATFSENPRAGSAYDPRSPLSVGQATRTRCDPFASMHGCR